jgi:hypothetical protein
MLLFPENMYMGLVTGLVVSTGDEFVGDIIFAFLSTPMYLENIK